MRSLIRRALHRLRVWLNEAETARPAAPGDARPSWWVDLAEYVDVHPSAILGPGAMIDVKYRPSCPSVCVTLGADSQLFGALIVQRPGASIRIGQRCQIGSSSLIAADSIEIGDDVLMAWNVTLMDNDSHSLDWEGRRDDVAQCARDYRDTPTDFARNKDWSEVPSASIRVGSKAWIGFGASILKGVTIGEGAVIGACSVVTRDVPPYCVAAGNPARVVRVLSRVEAGS